VSLDLLNNQFLRSDGAGGAVFAAGLEPPIHAPHPCPPLIR